MNSIERIEAAIRLEEGDRVPVAPIYWAHSAVIAGKTVKKYREDVKTQFHCVDKVYDYYGFDMNYLWVNPDMVNILSKEPVRCNTCYNNTGCRIAVLPDPLIKTRKDVRELMHKGFYEYLDLSSKRFKNVLKWGKDAYEMYPKFVKKYRKLGVPTEAGGTALGVDFTAMLRGLPNFFEDMKKHPRELLELIEFVNKITKTFAVQSTRMMGKGSHTEIGCWLGSPTFMSPRDFDKFIYPYVKETCDAVKKVGGHVTVHLDGDYSKTIQKFTKIDSIDIIQLEFTDLLVAKRKLQGKKCFMGGIHPSHLVLHSPAEVLREAGALVRKCGKGGGFILASACEVPLNAKPENMKALKMAVEKYGKYPIK